MPCTSRRSSSITTSSSERDGQDQQPADQPTGARVVGHQSGDLGQREHEDKVEEQFQRCYVGVLADLLQARPSSSRRGHEANRTRAREDAAQLTGQRGSAIEGNFGGPE
jgi:hypothetical protein